MPESKSEEQSSASSATDYSISQEKTVVRSLSLGGSPVGGNPAAVDIRDGRIIRIRPIHYDWKYKKEDFNPWKIEKNGKVLEPLMKSLLASFSLAYKKRVYSPNRIKYPLKRIDWDPNGERHTENRGKSKYERISWDKASEIIANEIRRMHEKYGPYSILAQGMGHGECKTVHPSHGCQTLLLDKLKGYTLEIRNPDSWEGWYWGAKHVWGEGWLGLMRPADNIVKDVSENSDMVLFWGCDPETTPRGFTGQFASRLCYFWTEVGIKQVYICPDVNYGCAVHADKWIPILPNTDVALQLAIIYTWIKEGTYDREYVETHTIGFDKIKTYIMGEEDGVPKTPAWASKKCAVPEWTIKALARYWAKKTVSIAHYFGGSYIRGPYSHEPARLECVLLGMQGLGKPGVHQCQITYAGMPRSEAKLGASLFSNPVYDLKIMELTKQFIPRCFVQKAILNPPVISWGSGLGEAKVEDQFKKYTYPIPKDDGGSEIHMIWTDGPCFTTCWNCGNGIVEAYRSPKIECIVAQHPWLENDCLFADIILPVSTNLELDDIMVNLRQGVQFQSAMLQKQAIEALGESKSDFEVVAEVAKKLGMFEAITGGKTIEERIKIAFGNIGLNRYISWEEFADKSYYVFPIAPDWDKDPAGMIKFYDDPEANPLQTPSGKLEFYSERLAKQFPDDKERPPVPHWIEKSETHDERISGSRAKKFPLLMISNHGRWRFHAQCDDISWQREIQTCKVKGWDGYMYEPLWMHPSDAARRGIENGDIVKVFNERGIVLGGALVWERIMPGVVSMDHGARVDPIIPGKLDRGGAINLISPIGTSSKNTAGMATSGYLVEVERVSMGEMEEWRKQYPEAFKREYDPASGLQFNEWIRSN